MSWNNSPNLMNQLPNELLILILERLKINDLIQCSLVCKHFKLLCQSVKIPELIISNTTKNVKYIWFYTNKQFNLQDAITVATFNSYRSIFRLDTIRRVHFKGCLSDYAQLQVNDFTQLEQLEIKVENVKNADHAKNYIHINLQNLKIVEIDTSKVRFLVTTPKLEILKCQNFNAISIAHPDTITYLETYFYTESLHALKNLQTLLIAYGEEFNWSDTLSAFPNLATLYFNDNCGLDISKSIENLVTHKRMHQRSLPKIYFLSVELNDMNKIDEYNNVRNRSLFQINNFNLLAETIFNCKMNDSISYDEVMDAMKGNIPTDFFKKFFYIRSIYANQVVDQEHFFGFLKNFEYLSSVNLPFDSLDQSFYNRLDEFDHLIKVAVEGPLYLETPPNLDPNLNFDVLLRLKNLNYVSIHVEYPQFFDLTPKLFIQLKYFTSMSFVFNEEYVMIKKDRKSNDYTVNYCGDEKTQLDFNGLVCQMDTIRNLTITRL